MRSHILIEGDGLLADYTADLLKKQYTVKRERGFAEVDGKINLGLVLHDGWQPMTDQKVQERFHNASIPWLRGFILFGEGIIGPSIFPDKKGCSHCADIRRLIAGPDRQEMWGIHVKMKGSKSYHRDSWSSRTGIRQLALLIERYVERIFAGETDSLKNKIYVTDLRTFMTTAHFFLPDPLCPECSSIPADTKELAKLKIHSCLKVSRDQYRSRPINELQSFLSKDYFDYRTGIMNGKMQDYQLPFADVLINMPMLGGDEGVAGRSHSYVISEQTAILEGLERYCGMEARGKKTVIRDSYKNLQKDALNPERVGLHEEEQYRQLNFPFQPFQPDNQMNWVWGYSFLQDRPILVPERLAYYSLGLGEGFVYETSNGCAIGSSMEEAIFHGIMEVIERDSFLLTWYATLPLVRLDLRSSNDPEVQLMADRIQEVSGYDLFFYNATMEHGIPSVFAIAKNRKASGVNLICAAGANSNPLHAVKSAMFELAGMMHRRDEKLEKNRSKYERMLENSYEVKTMEDHGMLYGLPEAEGRLHFLLKNYDSVSTFAEEFTQPPKRMDLKEDLVDLLERFRRLDLEIIVVDQSNPVIKRNGLACVKVLIPGMLPMTFGHHLTRIKGLERALSVPMKLGYTKQRLEYGKLNPYPHPFP